MMPDHVPNWLHPLALLPAIYEKLVALYPCQQAGFFSIFFIFAILVDEWWYLVVNLICVSLISDAVEYIS